MAFDQRKDCFSEFISIPGKNSEPAKNFLCDFMTEDIVAVVGDDHPSLLELPLGCRWLPYIMIKGGQQQGQFFLLRNLHKFG